MFKNLYNYWLDTVQKPCVMYVFNTWLLTQAKCHIIKLSKTLNHCIESLTNFKIKKLKIIPKPVTYDSFMRHYFFILMFLLILLILLACIML